MASKFRQRDIIGILHNSTHPVWFHIGTRMSGKLSNEAWRAQIMRLQIQTIQNGLSPLFQQLPLNGSLVYCISSIDTLLTIVLLLCPVSTIVLLATIGSIVVASMSAKLTRALIQEALDAASLDLKHWTSILPF